MESDSLIKTPCQIIFPNSLIIEYEKKLYSRGCLTVPPKHHRATIVKKNGQLVDPKNDGYRGIWTGSKRMITIGKLEKAILGSICHRMVSEAIHWFLIRYEFLNNHAFFITGTLQDFPATYGLYNHINKWIKLNYAADFTDDSVFTAMSRAHIIRQLYRDEDFCDSIKRYVHELFYLQKMADAFLENKELVPAEFDHVGQCQLESDIGNRRPPRLYAVSYLAILHKVATSKWAAQLDRVFTSARECYNFTETLETGFLTESIRAHLEWFSAGYDPLSIKRATDYFKDHIVKIMAQEISLFIMTFVAQLLSFTALTNKGDTSKSSSFDIFPHIIAVITEEMGPHLVVLREDIRLMVEMIS